jgi:hypothetical protein
MTFFFTFRKTSYLNEEVNRTKPSLSVSVPCLNVLVTMWFSNQIISLLIINICFFSFGHYWTGFHKTSGNSFKDVNKYLQGTLRLFYLSYACHLLILINFEDSPKWGVQYLKGENLKVVFGRVFNFKLDSFNP